MDERSRTILIGTGGGFLIWALMAIPLAISDHDQEQAKILAQQREDIADRAFAQKMKKQIILWRTPARYFYNGAGHVWVPAAQTTYTLLAGDQMEILFYDPQTKGGQYRFYPRPDAIQYYRQTDEADAMRRDGDHTVCASPYEFASLPQQGWDHMLMLRHMVEGGPALP